MIPTLQQINELDPNNSEAVKNTLSSFFSNLPKQKNIDQFRNLKSLGCILTRFSKYCSSHRTTIETYLAQHIDSIYVYEVIEAAKCAHSLQQVRPSQEKTATAKICWREHQIVLCNAAHKIIGILFSKAIDLYKGHGAGQKTQLASTTDSPMYAALQPTYKSQNNNVDKKSFLCNKLKNILVFLQAILVEPFPVAKPIQPQTILEVLVRALTVSSAKNTNLDDAKIGDIKIETLRTLDALVACLGPNLIPFSPLIFRFVIQTLRWSSENVTDESRKVRCSAYKSAAGWLLVLGATRTNRGVDDLAEQVLRDITPHKHVVQLTMNHQPTKHLSKKAKRKLTNAMLKESTISAHTPGEKNKAPQASNTSDEVARAALECAEILLTACGVFMNLSTYKMIQERLVRECYQLDTYEEERRILLLRALEAARRSCPPTTAPHTQHCLRLYSGLTAHTDSQISKFCTQALLDIRLQLHCAPPSISFGLEAQDKQSTAEKRKNVSEQNRAALVSLLGKDRVLEVDMDNVDGEVIDISEEPTNKKVRKSIETDQISLSSDSGDSVVIREDLIEAEEASETASPSKQNDNPNSETLDVTVDTETLVEGNISNNDCEEIAADDIATKDVDNTNDIATKDVDNTNDIETPMIVELDITDKTPNTTENIHEAETQIPLNASNETIGEEHSPLSMEVAYDFPNTGTDKVTVLDKVDDDNLPSTNDTDDVQITCGQEAKNSQDLETEKNKEPVIKENGTKTNGDKTPEHNANLDVRENAVNGLPTPKEMTVEDMLADFVDEVK